MTLTNQRLAGLRVVNTRPCAQGEALNAQIKEAGGEVLLFPVIEILALNTHWLTLLPNLNTVSQAIFISSNAVHYGFTGLAKGLIVWPDTIQVNAIGKATAQALTSYQVPNIIIPKQSTSEAFLGQSHLQLVRNQTILLFKGVGGRRLIANVLGMRGAHVVELEVYQRTIPQIAQHIIDQWRQPKTATKADIWLLTSEEAIHNLFDLLGHADWLKTITALVISTRLADIAQRLGIKNSMVCSPDSIFAELEQFQNQNLDQNSKRTLA